VERTAKGTVIGWDSDTRVLRYIQDPTLHTDSDGKMYTFNGTNNVVGQTSGAIGYINIVTTSLDGLSFVSGYSRPEIKKYTGELLYLSNIQPIPRDPSQSESIGILIHY
jgi:hypothetical protein